MYSWILASSWKLKSGYHIEEDQRTKWMSGVKLLTSRNDLSKPLAGCLFRGTVYTDGVSITIIKTNVETSAGSPRKEYVKKKLMVTHLTSRKCLQASSLV
jgi:hypothetical protein